MLTRKKNIEIIVSKLSILHFYVRANSKAGFTDINLHCENFFCELFNIFYDANFKNLNSSTKNHPAIDLGDLKNGDKGVGVQITSSNATKKIKDTITKFEANELDKKYELLIIFIIGEKRKTEFESRTNINIIVKDIYDFIDRIYNSNDNKIKKILNFINSRMDEEFFEYITNENKYRIQKQSLIPFDKADSLFEFMDMMEPNEKEDRINYRKDLKKLSHSLSQLNKKSRQFLVELIHLRHKDKKDKSSRIYTTSAKINTNIFSSDKYDIIKTLMSDQWVDEVEISINSSIQEGIEVKDETEWYMWFYVIDYLENRYNSLDNLFIDLDFSVLDK